MLSCMVIVMVADLKRRYKYALITGVVIAWLVMQYFIVEAREQTLKTWCESRDGQVEQVPTVGNVCILERSNE